jgi:hypothetical protein
MNDDARNHEREDNIGVFMYTNFMYYIINFWALVLVNLAAREVFGNLPYFSIDKTHLMYNAHPKLFWHSFWCTDNVHDAN